MSRIHTLRASLLATVIALGGLGVAHAQRAPRPADPEPARAPAGEPARTDRAEMMMLCPPFEDRADADRRMSRVRQTSGRILATKHVQVRGGAEPRQHVVALIAPERGERLIVDLGPRDALPSRQLRRNQQLAVEGRVGVIDGQQVLIAQRVRLGDRVHTIDRMHGMAPPGEEVEPAPAPPPRPTR